MTVVFTMVRNVRCAAGLIGLAALLSVTAPAQAQASQGDQPAVAFGQNGRMVRGTVNTVAADHLTVKTEAGDLYQVSVSPNTQVRNGRDPIKYADIHVGDGVGAMGELDRPNKTVHALALYVVTAEQLKKAREDMGKTYITGKVTAIDELKLTILRSDNVTQVITVDEGTSFKRGGRGMQQAFGGGLDGLGGGAGGGGGRYRQGAGGGTAPAAAPAEAAGESITLADLKVGDLVAGRGALKSGVFIPTELNVSDAPARGQRRRSAEGGDSAAAPASGAAAGTPAGPK